MHYSVIIIYLNFYNSHHRSYNVFINTEGYIEPQATCSEEYKHIDFSLGSIEVHVNNRYFEL